MHMRLRSVVLASLAAASAFGCGTKGSATTPSPTTPDTNVISIGFVGSLTQASSDVGKEVQSGVNVAVAQLNAFGGILGKQIVVQQQDDGSDLTGMATATGVNTLAQQGIVVGIGPTTNAGAAAMAPLIAQDQVLYISPSATQQSLDSISSADGGPSCATMAGASSSPVFFRTTTPSRSSSRTIRMEREWRRSSRTI
jgi:branched-chain amino acid transport system substrate-binding protein